MRVLVSTTAGSGHFGPLIPFCVACRDAGHEVRVAAPASFAGAVAGAGFEHAPFADVAPEVMGPIFGRLPELSMEEANVMVIGQIFGRLDEQAALPGVMAAIDRWRPDLVMREPTDPPPWLPPSGPESPRCKWRSASSASSRQRGRSCPSPSLN